MKENIHYIIAALGGAIIIVWTILQNQGDGDKLPIYTFDTGFGVVLIVIGVYLISKFFLMKDQ